MLELKVLFLLTFLIKFGGSYTKNNNVDVLLRQFFENLKENPKVKEGSFNEQVKEFIDKQIENYISLVKEGKYLKNHVLKKRSTSNIDAMDTLTRDETGVYILDGFIPVYTIGTSHPKDIKLFTHKKLNFEQLYAISLEVDPKNSTNYLVIYRFTENKFLKMISKTIHSGYKLAVHTTPYFSIIVIIGDGEMSDTNLVEKPGVYVFDLEEKLTKIQSLDTQFASDVSLWVQNRNLFLGISNKMSLKKDKKIDFEVYSPVYQWKGGHFDMIQKIKTYNSQRVLPFSIWDSHYLIYANRRNNKGELNIFSELYKYDIHTSQYVLHQKILTYGVKDVKHFCFFQANRKENFLIIANSNNNETNTLILKYVDDYFLPFQNIEGLEGVKEWLPVVGGNGSFALLAVTENFGIRAFQYNGWNFEDTDLEYSDRAFSKGVNSVNSYLIDNNLLITVANENDNGKMMNIFEPVFTHKNMLNDFHNEMLTWCEKNLKMLQENDKKITKRDTINNNEQLIVEIQTEIDKNFVIIEELEDVVENAVKISETNVISGDINAEKITLSQEDNILNSLTSSTVNHVDVVKLLTNVIGLNDDFTVQQPMKLKSVQIDNKIEPKFINGHSAEELINTNNNNFIQNLTIIGNVKFEAGLKIKGSLNKIKFDKENILLVNTDQYFKGFLEIQNIYVTNLTVNSMNDFKNKKSLSLAKVKEVHVENLTLDGLINNISITDIKEDALKVFGNQEISSKKYSFEHLFVNDLQAETIGNVKIPDDLLLINDGNYQLQNSIEFNNLTVRNLVVNQNLNGIPVTKGKLDVVLVDSDEEQRITGHKIFENVEVLNPIDLQGQIDNKELSKTNPVVRIEKEIVLDGDRTITGNVTIEDFVVAEDVLTNDQTSSLNNLQNKGLPLNAKKIPVRLNFKQQIKVGDLFVDKINGIFVSSLVTTGNKELQVVTGWKRIKNDVTITGNATIVNINEINLKHFENDVLKTNGDQVIKGNHFFKNLIANRITGDKIYFQNVPLTDINKNVKKNILITAPLTKLNSIKVNNLVLKNGTINGHNINQIINDSVFLDKPTPITGHKTFDRLTVKDLFVQKGMDKTVIPKMVQNADGTVEFQDDIQLPQVSVESLIIKKGLNQIPVDKLDKMFLNKMKLKVYGNVRFHKMVVLGQAFVEDDRINNFSIRRMYEDSVKIDEPHEFKAASFENGIESTQPLSLNGEFLGVDLLNIVQSDNANEIFIENKIFNNDIFVHGNLVFNGLVSGVNFTHLCEFVDLKYGKDLVIEGNAYFLKGPSVNYVNNVYLENLKDKFNYSNERHVFNPTKQFETIIFEGDVIVDQFVNNVDLRIVGETYFSKTKDQFVSETLSFNGGIVFEKDVSAKEAIVLGEIYGIDFEEIKRTVLLHGEDQLFSMPVAIKSSHINALNGDEYTLNGYNLETDFMRYDKENVVTGKKTINNLNVRNVIMDRNINIQGIDVLKWFQQSVLKKGSFKISGKTIFKNSDVTFSNGLSVQKNVNGMVFNKDTVLTRSYPQVISGKKIFWKSDNVLHFKSLNLKGTWNGKDVKEMFENQVLHTPNVRLYSPIRFTKNINASNVNINIYRGVNVSEFIQNVTNFQRYVTHEKYDNLYNMAVKIDNSFSNQAYYMSYYKLIQNFPKTRYAFPIIKSNKKDNLFAIVPKGTELFKIKFYEWNGDNELFNKDAGEIVFDNNDVTFMKPLQFNDTTNIYLEFSDDKNNSLLKGQKRGNMYIINDFTKLDLNYQIADTSILNVKPINIPEFNNTNCVIVLKTNRLLFYCEGVDEKIGNLDLVQDIEISGIVQVENVVIGDVYSIFVVLNNRKFDEKKEAQIEILKYEDGHLQIIQKIYVIQPSSISAIKFKNSYYFAVVSQQVQNAQYPGTVHIRRFNLKTQQFDKYQDIQLQSPFEIKFSILPSEELVLYVLTKTPTQPLVIFVYEGIVGFKEKIIASTLPKLENIDCFSTSHRHFIYAKSDDNLLLMEASFVGMNHP